MMDSRLSEFVQLLRKRGFRISAAETIDAVAAAAITGYADEASFREVLALTLVKSQSDRPLFDDCFDRFFRFSRWDSPETVDDREAEQTPSSADGGMPGGGSGMQPGSGLGDLLLNGSSDEVELRMAEAARQANLQNIRVLTQKGLFGRRIMMAMGLEDLEAEITRLDQSPIPSAAQLAVRLREARERLRDRVRQQVENYYLLARQDLRESVIREVDVATLREFRDVQLVVRKMAKRLVSTHSRRRRVYRRGVLDLRATLRRNAGYDGVLMETQWRTKRVDRPKIVAVCDVSRSVQVYARFLLMFLYSLQEVLPRVRAFAFSSHLGEVTDLFEKESFDNAVDQVMDRYGLGSTDYGAAWEQMFDAVAPQIDKRTTMIVLGDARNNNGDPALSAWRALAGRARQVIWINPESRNRWGSGDSEMLRYLPQTTLATSCRSLNDLERLVDRLLVRAG